MRNRKIEQYSFISSEEKEYEEKLNNRIRELIDKDPKVSFTAEGARICYTELIEPEEVPVTEKGCTFTCGECPMFEPRKKKDGTPDYRSKYGDCEYAEMHRTWKTNTACEALYLAIKNGDVWLTRVEQEEVVIVREGK